MPTIIPTESLSAQEIARRLLEHADSPDDVTTDSSGRTTAFVVSDELATAAGFDVSDSDVVDTPDGDADTAGPGDDGVDADALNAPAADSPDDVNEPPRGGKGSGGQVWLAFLNEQGVAVPEHLTADDRDDLVAVWDDHLDAQK